MRNFSKPGQGKQNQLEKTVQESSFEKNDNSGIIKVPRIEINTVDHFSVIKKAEELVIDSEEKAQIATETGKQLKNLEKYFENERKFFVDDLNRHVKNINSRFKERYLDPIGKAIPILRKKLSDYLQEQERLKKEEAEKKRKEQEEELLAEAELADSLRPGLGDKILESAPTTPLKPQKTMTRTITGASSHLSKRWTYEVIDITELAKAKPELVQAIGTEITKLINAGTRELPGVKIFQKATANFR